MRWYACAMAGGDVPMVGFDNGGVVGCGLGGAVRHCRQDRVASYFEVPPRGQIFSPSGPPFGSPTVLPALAFCQLAPLLPGEAWLW